MGRLNRSNANSGRSRDNIYKLYTIGIKNYVGYSITRSVKKFEWLIKLFNTIPPGATDDVVDADDDDRDGATEVQTKFYHSQYYTMITTKSKDKNTTTKVQIYVY